MTDVCVPAMGDEGFVAWLDRVIDRTERDLAEAMERTGRLTGALVKLRDARAVLTTAAGSAKSAEPTAKTPLYSCPHCPRLFASGASLGGHIGKAHPGAKAARQAAANAAPVAAAASVPARNGTAAAPHVKTEAPACDPAPPLAQPGEMVCDVQSDRGGACWFAARDAEQMDRHLRRRHALYGGDDPDDVEFRAEAVRAAQAKAGLPAEWGL